ncbi:hypothetical protein TREMEDRAFT_64943 [Tremella mesenterica DSM 1558]|uniref:uncharacterized protein n=1 Tax=Tremella mesenterica (strain ATCC 24925 / CBS 8224 / DSM 1558 / NBRC 9311 / NRRL Y-6157 / RJB 2259-6 / UBC 559-6) TaxID=578456 RepID=UPI0003F4A2B9|nr:uncharacterized protein TREMEDRAFT_64943 [Tremella mesenterica DSM 1558]EIW67073.1 hypothetical protein TREMEDRAFT_64943 [Tremella mesenterica DSM 1558]
MSSSSSLSRDNLKKDLDHLSKTPAILSSILAKPNSTFPQSSSQSLDPSKPTPPSFSHPLNPNDHPAVTITNRDLQKTAEKPAIEILETFSLSTATPDQGQQLIRGYIKEMDKIGRLDQVSQEELGKNIDVLRERAEGIETALGHVKLV